MQNARNFQWKSDSECLHRTIQFDIYSCDSTLEIQRYIRILRDVLLYVDRSKNFKLGNWVFVADVM